MIGNRTVAALAALAMAAGSIGGLAAPASAASVGITFGVQGDYGYPPPGHRECWRWSRYQHQWVWTCHHRRHPVIMFDMQHHRWHDRDH